MENARELPEVISFLQELGLEQYHDTFKTHAIDDTELPHLTDKDLQELRIPLGHRKKLLRAINTLQTGKSESDSTTDLFHPGLVQNELADLDATLNGSGISARQIHSGERKFVTVLFADIKDSTRRIQFLDAEDAQELFDPIVSAMIDSVRKFGGTVNQVMGDGIMALFGAPIAHEDHGVRACYAALSMHHAVSKISRHNSIGDNAPVNIRVGLHSGDLVVREIGDNLSMSYDAVGLTAHLAARMEQHAPSGGTYLSEATLKLTSDFVETIPKDPVLVKGLDDPVQVFELTGVKLQRTRWQASLARGLARFIGRKAELAQLDKCRQLAEVGPGQIVCVRGEAGSGKSRLFHEFTGHSALKGWKILTSLSVSYGKATDWLPVAELCRCWFGITHGDDVHSMQQKVTNTLHTLGVAEHATACYALLSLPIDDYNWQRLESRQQRRVMLNTMQTLVIRLSKLQPLVLVFEDLHWIDQQTQAFLDELVEVVPKYPILLLTNFRPEFDFTWESSKYTLLIELHQLPEKSVISLLEDKLGDNIQLNALKHQLIKHCHGNPLFVEESVRALEEAGILIPSANGYSISNMPDKLPLANNLRSQIADRIDALDAHLKQLLQTAAVIGTTIPEGLLQITSDLPSHELRDAIKKLQSAEFLVQGPLYPEPQHVFKHAHTHQVAYEGMLREQRRNLHRRTGEAMLQLFPDRETELAEDLASHFELGELWQQAVQYHLAAAEKARSRYIHTTALQHIEKALQCCDHVENGDSLFARAWTLRGDLESRMGNLDSGNDCYEKAVAYVADDQHKVQIENRIHNRRSVIRDGHRLVYYVHGSGDKTIVMVRIIGYDCALNQPMVERLCQKFRLVLVDILGTGDSDTVPDRYTTQDEIDDYAAIIKDLDLGAVTCIGVSGGDVHITKLAQQIPSMIDKLIFSGPCVTGDISPESIKKYYDVGSKGDLSMVDEFITEFSTNQFSEPEAQDFREQYASNLKKMSTESWLHWFQYDSNELLQPEWDITEQLVELQTKLPILLLHGTDDQVVPYSRTQDLLQHLPHAKHHPFNGKGHQLMVTATHEFCQVVTEFVNGE